MATSGDIGPCIRSSESSDVHRDKKVVMKILLDPLANSTPIGDIVKESGYATLEANDGDASDQFRKENCSGPGLLDPDGTVVENPQLKEKSQPKLTDKGKSYKLTQSTRERRRLKREIQTLMANIGALMGQDKNLKSVGEECKNLNDRFNLFGEIHEEIQELLTEDEKSKDCRIYDDLFEEINAFPKAVYKWMFDTDQRIRESKLERANVKSKNSKSSRVSVVSSKVRALEAKAKQAKLEARIAQLDQVEAAKREAERMRLKAECVAAAAVSKVYEDAVKEDTEQYLGSDDPDNDDIPIDAGHRPSGLSARVNDVTLN